MQRYDLTLFTLYGLQEVDRVEGLEDQSQDIKRGFFTQWAASGASGGKKLEAVKREYLAEIERGDRSLLVVTEAQATDLIKSMRAHRGTNKRVK